MPARTRLILLAVLSLTAAACGLKGPLYRAGEPRDDTVAPASSSGQTSSETSKNKQDRGSPSAGESSDPPVAPPDPDRPAVPPNP